VSAVGQELPFRTGGFGLVHPGRKSMCSVTTRMKGWLPAIME
jgi:hypothetical protein